MKERAPRNRTLTLTEAERADCLSRCLSVESPLRREALLDKTIHGDLFAVAPLLPESFVDLLIADPPYNLRKQYGEGRFRPMAPEEYAAYTERWLSAILHVLKPTASLYVCCDWRSGLALAPVLERRFLLRNRITWQREKGRGARANWKNVMEDVWFATCGKEYTFNAQAVKQRRRVLAPYRAEGRPKDWEETPEGRFRDSCGGNFWDDISIPYWSMPENTDHPAQKPEKLMAKFILASTDPGQVVLDPFMGSGSSVVAAKKLGRRYVGIELEAEYCALAEKRLELAGKDPSIQGYEDGVFWERNTLAARRRSRE